MSHVTYKIVQHDGGWAYTVDGVFSEPFPTHAAALAAAKRAAAEQRVPGRTEAIEYETADGKWHTETAAGSDRPETDVEDAALVIFRSMPARRLQAKNLMVPRIDRPRIDPRGVIACRAKRPGRSGRAPGRCTMKFSRAALSAVFAMTSFTARPRTIPAPKQGDWIARDFKFHTGETMPELRLHYTTVGEPTGQPVLVLHGSGGSAASMLTPAFAGELFGPGQPLDAAKYYIIIPDGIGHGKSSKPSDGMKTAFPKYDYDDMVDAQYRLVTEGLGVKHLRLVIGNSMGGMHTWLWGVKYPQFMDALVPMASQPTEMAARNWMLRRMMIETIRNDPDYNGGNYTSQPRMMKYAITAYGIAIGGGTLGLSDAGADRGQGRQDGRRSAGARRSRPTPTTSSTSGKPRTTTIPRPGWSRIEATVLAINAADDERNPPETGVTDAALEARQERPALSDPGQSTETRGHLTTGNAKFYKTAVAGIAADRTAARDVGTYFAATCGLISHRINLRSRASLIF